MICRETHTPYSGMLPGLVAGHYTFDEAHIDLGPLCRFAGARLYHDEAVGLDPISQSIHCRTRPSVGYDIVSVNIGSTPQVRNIPGADGNVVPVKPINQFISHWQSMVERVLARNNGVRIGVVGMRPGDRLILTKPIGTGTLFAADMRMKAKSRWIDAALASMVQSNRAAAMCLHSHGATACTDVTGFGLLGHLVEMTKPSGVDIELMLDALPFLDGALDTVRIGIMSSLQPQNVRLRRAIRDVATFADDERFPLIFDPQTAGGLLASIPGGRSDACLAELNRLGYGRAVIIGTVRPQSDQLEPIVLRR